MSRETAPSPAIPIFLINLDRDADRLSFMAAALAKLGLSFERIPAVLGLDMPEWVKPFFLRPDGTIASQLKRGEVGCHASHLVVARRMVEAGIPMALVFEDDLALPDDLATLVDAAVRVAPEGWDIIRLSNPPKAAYLPVAGLPGTRELVLYSRIPNNTGASLLSLSGAKRLLIPGQRTYQIDEHLRRPWDLGMETYGIVPAPIRSNIFDTSTIDAMETRGLGRESPLAKLARRRIDPPAMLLRQLRWQYTHLGIGPWLRAILVGLKISLARRLTAGRNADNKTGDGVQQRFRLDSDGE